MASGKDLMDLIERARAFAHAAHDGQTRKGVAQEPYVVHLEEVAALVAGAGGDAATVAAAWLHDTVEDCAIPLSRIEADFGPRVTAMVAEVSDDKALAKAERKRLQVVNAPHKSPGAALIKICDKTSNVRTVGHSPALGWDRARQDAYLDWAETVVAALPSGADPMRATFAAALAEARAAVARR